MKPAFDIATGMEWAYAFACVGHAVIGGQVMRNRHTRAADTTPGDLPVIFTGDMMHTSAHDTPGTRRALARGMDVDDRTLCQHCRTAKRAHGAHDNPVRPFACPGAKEPAWPSTIRDEKRAGEVYDQRLAKYWTERSTSFKAVR